MKFSKPLQWITPGFITASILFSSCASSTLIVSNPSGASVYINSEMVGETPYQHTDTKIVGSSSSIILKKNGYKDFHYTLIRNEQVDPGAIVAGFFFWPSFLWTMKYKDVHTFKLEPIRK